MHYLSIGAIFKNEAHILEEWLDHYIFHGVDHFYLINDFSTDNYIEIINKYKDKITLFNNLKVEKSRGRQTEFYNYFLKPILHETKFLAILDLDEFLYSPKEINLKNILKECENYGQIVVNWVWFSSNGNIEQPKSVVKGCTKRLEYGKKIFSPTPGGEWCMNGTLGPKTILNTSFNISNINIHGSESEGETINLSYEKFPIDPLLLINHYSLQSLDFFCKIKMTRGDVNGWFSTEERNLEYFKAWNVGDIYDDKLLIQNEEILKKFN
jgi:hypothetical protein